MGHRFRRHRHEYGGWPVLLPAEPHDRGNDHVLHLRRRPKAAPLLLPVAGPQHAASIPAGVDRGPRPDFVLPVLPFDSGVDQRHLHCHLLRDSACALLAAVGPVLRRGIPVHPHGRHLYRRRAAGAVRLGQPRMDVRRGGAGVHHRLPADREPDSLAEDFAAHDGYQRGRRLPLGAGVRLAVRRIRRVPGAAGHRIAAGHLPCVHQAL